MHSKFERQFYAISLFSILFLGSFTFAIPGVTPGPIQEAFAGQINAHLIVSAEDPAFSNTFAGPMVIEVIVDDPNIVSTTTAFAPPDVTVNGKILQLAQASDGRWHA